ncbi:cyclin-dependent kinase C-1-like isoform X1 [Tasmannia lanceolata]|uniref:cyclin-dependent kinase C-1-like isoform X1 n=1 Tax=Tasmannia lanceolata TaxID=3420 RepID=UPI0040640D26
MATGQLNLNELPSCGSRSVDCFEKLEQIGEGHYGQVYMAREIKTGQIVALKKIRMDNEREGFPRTAIREIKILKKLRHENIIRFKEIVTFTGPEKDEQGSADGNKNKGSIYIVLEYMDHDLQRLAHRHGKRFTVPQIKCYMRQLLTGLHYCHLNQVLHRDLKGSNLLIDNEGNLKLADFGLARFFSNDHNGNLTNHVITLGYRPPELLLGTTKYGPAVDMWSVGCIFAELLYGKPILPGKDEHEQLNKIYELCGAPDEVNWPGVSKIPWYNNLKPTRPMKRRVREVFKQEYPPWMHLMPSTSGKTLYLVIPRAYPNMNPCTSSKQRKRGNMKKWQRGRNYGIQTDTHRVEIKVGETKVDVTVWLATVMVEQKLK